ncbi:hypothetical protein GCM10008967_28600 [Bacillus carboniphilus]|uniref:Uncharacterized protein n=1 Tax=Bacillus carboniphilus TaxID=86663 RepID=A0ABN0WG44_9BACI
MKKRYFFMIFVFLLVIGFVFFHSIQSYLFKASFDNNKEVAIEAKAVSFDELYLNAFQQMKLAQQLESSTKYSLVAEEVRDGYEKTNETLHFLKEHPNIKSIKVELPITRYKDKDNIIEFISGKGKIIEVLINDEWVEYNAPE